MINDSCTVTSYQVAIACDKTLYAKFDIIFRLSNVTTNVTFGLNRIFKQNFHHIANYVVMQEFYIILCNIAMRVAIM